MASNCASCGSKAEMQCVGCLNAPEYYSGDATRTIYCSRTCQTQHRPEHKARCRTLGRRTRLFRAAHLFQKTVLAYREAFYDIDLEKIELENGALCLHQRLRSISARTKIVRFPAHLTDNAEYKEAALLKNQCTMAMALLGSLVRKLLKGLASTIEILDLHIGKPRLPTKLFPSPDASAVSHTVLKVQLHTTRELWIVDPAGGQYGFRDGLVPYDKYIADNSCLIKSVPATYDWTETKDLDYYMTLGYMNKIKAQRENWSAERKTRLHFAKFIDQSVEEDLLVGSTAEWKDKRDMFVAALKAHLLKIVV